MTILCSFGPSSMNKPQHTNTSVASSDPRWVAVISRDMTKGDSFVYAVTTTGIYCLPGCPSRLPKAENVIFFATREAAANAGFRACKRCSPDSSSLKTQRQNLVEELCRFIQDAEQTPSLAELSARAELSPYYLHRLFKQITGVTPNAYARMNRIKRVRAGLIPGTNNKENISATAYAAGYQSNSRFYAEATQSLGMEPKKYRAGGMNTQIYFALGECSLGSILVAQSERGICAISLGDDPDVLLEELQTQFPHATLIGDDTHYEVLVAQVIGIIEQPHTPFDLPLDIRGTLFQQKVWNALQKISPGQTLSYSQLAELIGSPGASRAVASACAANVLAVAIPCHRIVRSNGELSGYRWGVARKQALLKREQNC